jgi:hypothetical protein
MTEIAIIGDSHAAAIAAGARAGLLPVVGGPLVAATILHTPFFVFDPDLRITDKTAAANYEKWKAVTQSSGLGDFTGRVAVSMGLAAAPFYGNRMWLNFGPDRRPLSRGLFDTIIADLQRHVLEFYRQCVRRGVIAAAIEPPPPQRAHPAVQRMGADAVFSLASSYSKSIRDYLREASIPIVAVDCADRDGLLRPEFEGNDPSHANMRWGQQMTRKILETCRA